MDNAVILFHSSNHAMWAAEVLGETGVTCRLTSVPRHLSSDCGYCVRLQASDLELSLRILQREGIEVDRAELTDKST